MPEGELRETRPNFAARCAAAGCGGEIAAGEPRIWNGRHRQESRVWHKRCDPRNAPQGQAAPAAAPPASHPAPAPAAPAAAPPAPLPPLAPPPQAAPAVAEGAAQGTAAKLKGGAIELSLQRPYVSVHLKKRWDFNTNTVRLDAAEVTFGDFQGDQETTDQLAERVVSLAVRRLNALPVGKEI